MLMAATELTVDRLVTEIKSRGGLAVASHIDRGSFSLLSQLGFVPEEIAFDALELSYSCRSRGFPAREFTLEDISLPCITSSDAHHPKDIGRGAVDFFIETPTLDEIRCALGRNGGRKYELYHQQGV
jgi:hypothetical protein